MKLVMSDGAYETSLPTLKALFKRLKMPFIPRQSGWHNKHSNVNLNKNGDIVTLVVSMDKPYAEFLKKYIEGIGGHEDTQVIDTELDYRIKLEQEYWSGSDLTESEIKIQLEAFKRTWMDKYGKR